MLVASLICFLIAGLLIWRVLRRRYYVQRAPLFTGATTRKQTAEEQAAIERYLQLTSPTQDIITPSGSSAPPSELRLNARRDTVISLSHAITRYGFSVNDTNQWRFYLDATEVHLPLFWEQYIANDNDVELILTEPLPLVIALNGHTLQHYTQEPQLNIAPEQPGQQAFIRREESTPIELLGTRQESVEEHVLRTSRQLPEAILICLAFFILFLSVLGPPVLMPWLAGGAMALIAASLWSIFSPVSSSQLREIHRLRGTPKRWGLFGESHRDQINNISLGIIDLTYPPHWQPYITQDLGQKTDIDIYLDRHVVRQGAFLSLHDEVRLFPLQHWLRPLVIACGSLLILLMMMIWVPLEMPLKLSTSWLSGAKTIDVSSINDLNKFTLHVGDTLRASGTGTCHINAPDRYTANQNQPYLHFDCSQISWKESAPEALIASESTRQALALSEAVKLQINPSVKDSSKVNPQLATAIRRSGMVLLDDFSGIVLKTEALCQAKEECVRLKNALINLGNTKDWNTLVRWANNGRLDGVNVMLRPISAESLNNLVTTSTAPFFTREITHVARLLNAPIAGGYIFVNDEGRDLTVHVPSPSPLYDYPAQEQWAEFMNLAQTLSRAPFIAKGIITDTYTDTNGTQHVILQSTSDTYNDWRYTMISLLLGMMLVCFVVSSVIAINRYRRDRNRPGEIQRYYDHVLKSSAPLLLPKR